MDELPVELKPPAYPNCGQATLGSVEMGVLVCNSCRAKIGFPHRTTLVGHALFTSGGLAAVIAVPLFIWGWHLLSGLLAIYALLAIVAALILQHGLRPIVIARGPHCRNCGYDLTALAPGTPCPECGLVGHPVAERSS